MKYIAFGAIWCYLLIFGNHYQALIPQHDIPAGAVIKDSDFDHYDRTYWSSEKEDFPATRSDLIGHRALKFLPAGRTVHMADISK